MRIYFTLQNNNFEFDSKMKFSNVCHDWDWTYILSQLVYPSLDSKIIWLHSYHSNALCKSHLKDTRWYVISTTFSENYIFGKFDTFCKRLERIADMINTMEMFAGLGDVKIEGIDVIVVKFKTIVDNAKKKNYDILDHRKAEVIHSYWHYF